MKQDPLVVAVDPVHVDSQHAGRLDQLQPRQQPLHAPDGRVRRARLDPVQRRERLVVVDGDQRIKTFAHRCRQAFGHALRQQRPGLVSGRPDRAAQHRIGRCENVLVAEPGARPELAARRSARAATPRPRGTAPAVLRRRHRKRADAGTRRYAADAPRPSAAGARRRGSSQRRRPAARPRTSGSPRRSPGASVGGTGLADQAGGRETSGSETGTALSERNGVLTEQFKQQGT